MEAGKPDVFISYRRDGGSAEARLIRSALTDRGLNVFLDVTGLKQGHFDLTLLSRIAQARVFVLVLSPHSLERCTDEQDWLRREIAHAIQTGRNIIPVILPGFEFPRELPIDIQDLPRYQAVLYSHAFFEATITKLLDAIGGAAVGTLRPKITYYRFADYLWTRLGIRGLLPLVLLVVLPIGTYSFFRYAVNFTIPKLVGDFGVEFEAEDWTLRPLSLTCIARNVRLHPPHDTLAAPVFTADEVEFSGTLGTVLAGLGSDVLSMTTLGWLDIGQPFNQIRIIHGELHLEVSTTGQLNWTEFWDEVPHKRKDQLRKGLFPVNSVFIDRLKISYLEHIPERAGGGVIQTSQAHIDLDDVSGSIIDLAARGSSPVRYKFSGRSAGGVITVSGNAVFSTEEGRSPGAPPSTVSGVTLAASQTSPADIPYFPYIPAKMDIFLENIGAGAFAKAIPDATGIIATSGNLRGSIGLDVARDHYNCASNIEMNDVRLAPNPRVVVVKAEFDRVQRDLATWQTSGKFDACRPFAQKSSDGMTTSRASTLVAAFNAQATLHAPPSARAVAIRDQQTLTGADVTNAALNDVMGKLGAQAGQRVSTVLGPQTGRLVQHTLGSQGGGQIKPEAETTPGQPKSANPLTKGAKSVGQNVGHGIKKLFGHDKNDDKKKPSQ
jgi:hypothetical protein